MIDAFQSFPQRSLTVVLASGLAACILDFPGPDVEGGHRCETDEHCVSGYECIDGRCIQEGEDVDQCNPNPCQNGGTCVGGVDDYTCNCLAGYTGDGCETNIDDCSPNPCQNGGTCNDGIDRHTCTCPYGYAGIDCERTAGLIVFASNSGTTKTIVKFNANTGENLGSFGASESINYFSDMIVGPDDMLWVLDAIFTTGADNRVLRYDPLDGSFLGVWANTDGSAGYNRSMTFGPDGNLYITTATRILRYNGDTAEAMADLAASTPAFSDTYHIATGPDGYLYVTGNWTGGGGGIVRYDVDGNYYGIFASGGNENGPRKPVWDAAGDFYTANLNDGTVYKYNGTTGALIGIFADPPGNGHVPAVFVADGSLLVGDVWNDAIYRMNGSTGAFVSNFATGFSCACLAPW